MSNTSNKVDKVIGKTFCIIYKFPVPRPSPWLMQESRRFHEIPLIRFLSFDRNTKSKIDSTTTKDSEVYNLSIFFYRHVRLQALARR
ncbi:hypothetical protein V1478_013734 [Vespula squamosa]|uniref:Uncharacterized protein n=1 Tax=Vespula squamosa TaxID=30214 RepID=A0ABD2A5Z0_VESSQ